MKLTNCYRYMAVLYTASCGAASPLYGPLETGLQESQLLNSLKTCKSLEGPETDAYLSRTGLNGAYKTKKTYWRPFLLPAFRVRKGWRSESRFLLLHHQSG